MVFAEFQRKARLRDLSLFGVAFLEPESAVPDLRIIEGFLHRVDRSVTDEIRVEGLDPLELRFLEEYGLYLADDFILPGRRAELFPGKIVAIHGPAEILPVFPLPTTQ